MKKIDFDFLMTPIDKTKRKDISLVEGYSLIAQQIKNIVLMDENEIPFSKAIGANIISILKTNRSYLVFVINSINTKIKYSIKNIFNVYSILENNGSSDKNITVKIYFSYKKNPESEPSPSELSIPITIL